MNQLKGLKVLELASVLAGPGVGQFFAETGAEVIKVENLRLGGDVTRSWKTAGEQTDDRSAYFCCVNWGKQSIAVDLTLLEGREIVHRLASESDILIASFKPGDAKKLGVDYGNISAINPKIIYGQITGYGSANTKVGYDAILQAEAGFMFMNGEPGGRSLKMPVALVDILAGHQLKEALLLALIERMQHGVGKFVEVSLLHAAVASLANQATNWLMTGKLPKKHGSAHPNIAPYGDMFVTRDEREFLLAVGNDRQFTDLCRVLSVSGLAEDSRFSTNVKRVENREQLNAVLRQQIGKVDAGRLSDLLDAAQVPAACIQDMQQVFAMPGAQELLMSNDLLKGVRTFVGRSDGESFPDLTPPPRLGADTFRILKSLSYPQSKIDSLLNQGVVAGR